MVFNPILTFVGNLVADPELNFTSSGISVCNFTLAHTPSVFNRDTETWEDQETLFLRCTAWRQLAENVSESVSRGDRLIVAGRMSCSVWEDDNGNTQRRFELQADTVGAELSWHTAAVKKAVRSKSGAGKNSGRSGSQSRDAEEVSEPKTTSRPPVRVRKAASARR